MRLAVIGLGYVGTVSAACFAGAGHRVVGVDVAAAKVDAINAGRSPVLEPGVDELVAAAVADGRLRATADCAAAVRASEVSLICVGTPSGRGGSLDLGFVERVCGEIGEALRERPDGEPHVVALRSTMLPLSIEGRLIPILERASQRRAGIGFAVAMNPEFLREGSAVADFRAPARIVVGARDEHPGDVAGGDRVMAMYDGIDAPRVRCDLRTAELLKYVDNAFHATKVAFANEIGRLAEELELDGRQVMEAFCLDTRLNISPAYLRPGSAFGGSCLPKDLRALVDFSRSHRLSTPLLEAVLPSNEVQKERALERVLEGGERRIGLLGLSFKAGTDDLRESPAVALAEALIGKGRELAIYDRHVSPERLVGANRAYVERELPHLASLLRRDLDEVLQHAEVLVIASGDPDFADVAPREGQRLVDLVGVKPGR